MKNTNISSVQSPSHNFTVGDFVQYTMVTDSVVLEVVRVSAKSIWIRRTKGGEILRSDNHDGNPYPVVYTEQVADEGGAVQRLGLTKKGFFRIDRSFGRIYPAHTINGKPVRKVDYRM